MFIKRHIPPLALHLRRDDEDDRTIKSNYKDL